MSEKEIKIVTAAQKLFLRHGLKKVTLSDIAEAANLSRPSVYSAFANKEAVIGAIIRIHLQKNQAETEARMPAQKGLKAKLDCLFKIWIIDPFASAIRTESGKEMMETISEHAPVDYAQIYIQFEKHLSSIFEQHLPSRAPLAAKDLARILTLATQGLKTSSSSLPELKRMIDGLIKLASVE